MEEEDLHNHLPMSSRQIPAKKNPTCKAGSAMSNKITHESSYIYTSKTEVKSNLKTDTSICLRLICEKSDPAIFWIRYKPALNLGLKYRHQRLNSTETTKRKNIINENVKRLNKNEKFDAPKNAFIFKMMESMKKTIVF